MAPAKLTEKQQQVYGLLTDDKDPKEIATALGVSKAAIYSHIRSIKEAGHPVPAKYANVGTGGGRGGRSAKRGTGRSAGKRATGTRGKATAAVVSAAPTPAPTPTADALPFASAETIVTDLSTGMGRHRKEIADRLATIASQVEGLEESIASLNEEAQTLRNTDATLEAMQKTLSEGPPAEASTNGSGTPDLAGVKG